MLFSLFRRSQVAVLVRGCGGGTLFPRTWAGRVIALARSLVRPWLVKAAVVLLPAIAALGGDRSVRVSDATMARGQTNCVPIILSALGNENALGLSLCFDTNLLGFVSARRGTNAASVTLTVNASQSTRGRVGIALAVPAGESFASGDNEILQVCFRAAPGGGLVTTPLSLCDTPISRDIVTVEANTVTARYTNGLLTLLGSCSYTLAATEAAFNSSGGDSTVGVMTEPGCSWSAASGAPWITVTAGPGGTGPGLVSCQVAPNPDYSARTGQVMIAGQIFRVVQAGIPCGFQLNLNQRTHGPAAEFHFFEVTATTGCRWTVQNAESWISITSPSNWVGNGRVDYWVGANPSGLDRTGLVTVADQTFTIIQLGYACTYALSPQSRAHNPVSESAIVNVTAPAGCAWYVVNTNDWMIIKLYTNGVGSDIVRYTVFPNPYPRARSGALTIGGETFTVNQAAAPCVYSLLQANQFYGPGPSSDIVSLSALADCAWTATTANNWIVISNASGIGGGQIRYFVAPNWAPADRTGTIQIASQRLTITQLGTPCSFSISPTSRSVTSGANTGSVSVSFSASGGATSSNQVCYWTALNTNSWITVYQPAIPANKGSFTYSIAANTFGAARSGNIVVGGRNFAVSQAGIPCTYSVSPASRSHGYDVETGLVSFTTVIGCVWSANPSAAWIIITSPASGASSGSVAYRLAQNTGPARSGTITIGSATFTINQGAATAVTITTQPTARNVAFGSNVTFTVAATGTAPLSYQWRFNGTNLVNGPGVFGATTSTLIVSNVQHARSGNYSVVVSNLRGSVASANAALLVNTPPTLNPIANRSTVRANLVTFTATASDLQAPPQALTYSLVAGAPAGAAINSASGIFTWTPAAGQALGGYPITVRVTDNGIPPFSAQTTTTLSVFAGYTTNVTLVPTGAVWSYRDTGENLGSAWTALSYDDTLWAAGPGPLGYGNGNEATVVGWGSNASARYITTYFRRKFNITSPSVFTSLALRLKRDDGAVIHLNGVEMFRENMPVGPINHLTVAASGLGTAEEAVIITATNLDPALLVAHDNVVGVEIHQRTADSGDIAVDLELTGRMTVFTGGAPASLIQSTVLRIAFGQQGGVLLSWDAVPTHHYQLQFATNLTAPNWKNLGGEILSTSSPAGVLDGAPLSAQRFYRVLIRD